MERKYPYLYDRSLQPELPSEVEKHVCMIPHHERFPMETHKSFAAALALILPDPTYHRLAPSMNITPDVIINAASGSYAKCAFDKVTYPLAFTADYYYGHLLPVIEELPQVFYLQPDQPQP